MPIVTPVQVVKKPRVQPQVNQTQTQQPQVQQQIQNNQQPSHSPQPQVMVSPHQINNQLQAYPYPPQQVHHPQVIYHQPQPGVLQITPQDLAIIIYAAQGKDIRGMLNIPVEEQGFIASTLGAAGDGMHRMADGARDIVGGLIDVLTLGKSRR